MIQRSLLLFAILASAAGVSSAIAQVDGEKKADRNQQNFLQSPEILKLLDSNPDVQRRFDKWLNSRAQEQLDAKSGDAPANPALRENLLERMKRDQEVRN